MTLTKKIITYMLCFTPAFVYAKAEDEKLADDPTKVITKLGLGYSNNFNFDNSSVSVSGSLALDPVRKINAGVNQDGSEWNIGGSWLFDIGIVNFRFARNTLENETTQTSYSVGTFLPLSVFGIEPFGIQIFPMSGYTYNTGEQRCNYEEDSYQDCGLSDMPTESNGYVFLPTSNHSGYLGAFALKPVNPYLNLMAFGGGALGSDDYSGYWAGMGLGTTIDDHNSVNFYTYFSDNSYGSDSGIGLNYTYEFK